MVPRLAVAGLTLFGYAFKTVARDRRRTLSALAGIVLAVAFIAGSNVAVDSTVRSILDARLAELEADFYAFGEISPSTLPRNLTQTYASVAGILRVEPRLLVPACCQVQKKDGNASSVSAQALAVETSYYTSIRRSNLSGSFTLATGKVVVSQAKAIQLNVTVGNTVMVVFTYLGFSNGTRVWRTAYYNLTVEGILSHPPPLSAGPAGIESAPLFIGMGQAYDIIRFLNGASGGGYIFNSQFLLWLDRARVIDPYDLQGTNQRLERVSQDLMDLARPMNFGTYSAISYALQGFDVAISAQRTLFLAYSIPVVLLGIYLGATGSELGMAERRRELGILKARGAGPGQVFSLLVVEALLLGLAAGILGLVLGLVISRVFLQSAASATQALAPSYLEFALTPWSLYASMGFAAAFSLAAGYRNSRRSSRLPVVESLQFYSPQEASVIYKPTVDLVLVSLAVATFIFVVYARQISGSLGILVFLVGGVFLVLVPFSPLLLVVGLTRLLTRSTGKVYGLVSKGLKFLTGELSDLVTKNIARNPRRSSSIGMIIAFGVAFGVFVTAVNGTQVVNEERRLTAAIGSDIQILDYQGNASAMLSYLSRVEGVQAVSPFSVTGGDPSAIALDARSYPSVVKLDGYFVAGNPGDALPALETPGNAIVSKGYYDRTSKGLGDTLTLFTWPSNYTRLNIVGVVELLPGLGYRYLGNPGLSIGLPQTTDSPALPEVYVDFKTIGRDLARSNLGAVQTSFLIKVRDGYDPVKVRDAVSPLLQTGGRILIYREELAKLRSEPVRNAFMSFLLVEVGFVVLILTVGLGLISYTASLERESEFASIAARGASTRLTSTILLGEAISIMVIGLLIGVTAGLLSAAVFNQLISYTAGSSQLDSPLVVPIESPLLVGAASLTMVAASFLVSLRIRFMDVARVLKIRGG